MYYFYFDASALVKRYTQEVGSDKINFLYRICSALQLELLRYSGFASMKSS